MSEDCRKMQQDCIPITVSPDNLLIIENGRTQNITDYIRGFKYCVNTLRHHFLISCIQCPSFPGTTQVTGLQGRAKSITHLFLKELPISHSPITFHFLQFQISIIINVCSLPPNYILGLPLISTTIKDKGTLLLLLQPD